MRVTIIGGGTAGHMALAHVSKHLPDAELTHIYESGRATIGVGEGTTPDFVHWLNSIGITIADLVSHCGATEKRGLGFEGWGKHQDYFDHEFFPRSQQAVHFSAAKLPDLLAARSQFKRVDDSVMSLKNDEEHAVVITQRGTRVPADLVIDARGFRPDPGIVTHQFDWITTDSALVTKSPTIRKSNFTRAVARPLGWVFCIPLANETSFGYVYHSQICTQEEASEDLQLFLKEDGVDTFNEFRPLSFPNFARRDIFDGRVLRIGNCASFLEPLEATAIGVIVLQLRLFDHWIELVDRDMPTTLAAERINRIHEDTLLKISIFIAWHYAAGSRYETPFWNHAADRFRRVTELPSLMKMFKQFESMLGEASAISPRLLENLNTEADLNGHFAPDAMRNNFGGYSQLSFAQIALGLDVFPVGVGK